MIWERLSRAIHYWQLIGVDKQYFRQMLKKKITARFSTYLADESVEWEPPISGKWPGHTRRSGQESYHSAPSKPVDEGGHSRRPSYGLCSIIENLDERKSCRRFLSVDISCDKSAHVHDSTKNAHENRLRIVAKAKKCCNDHGPTHGAV